MGHKYVGLDVHQSSTVAAGHDEQGKSVMESILATEAEGIRDFLKGLRGTVHVTFEEGTQVAWLNEIVKPVVAEVMVSAKLKRTEEATELRCGPPAVGSEGEVTGLPKEPQRLRTTRREKRCGTRGD